MHRTLRILLLLFVLATVGQWAWIERRRVVDWTQPLRVVTYPIDADDTAASRAYLAGLDASAFGEIDDYFAAEAKRHGHKLGRPVEIYLGPRIAKLPPRLPEKSTVLNAPSWSLRMRFWAWRNDRYSGAKPHVRLFIVYHDPARSPRLTHSTGLAKGMIGLVHAFAAKSQQSVNNVVIAHELLHTFGATDKYDLATNLPYYPDGYAEPAADPRFPQHLAEIMAGRIPRSPSVADVPSSLDETRIGLRTATEIHWRPTY